jgi:hypothetical protein
MYSVEIELASRWNGIRTKDIVLFTKIAHECSVGCNGMQLFKH